MTLTRSRLVALSVVSLATAALPQAQSQLLVVDRFAGPGSDFVQIDGAVAAAQEGDTILVRAGNYAPIVVDGKSVTIVGEPGVTIDSRRIDVRNLAPGQRVVLRGIGVDESSTFEPATFLQNNSGLVWVEECTFVGRAGSNAPISSDGGDGLHVTNSAAVVLARTSGVGAAGTDLEDEDVQFFAGDGGSGLVISGSDVAIYGGTYSGAVGGHVLDTIPQSGGQGGDGLSALDSRVLLSGVTSIGQRGGVGGEEFLFGQCGSGGDGGNGLRLTGVSEGYVRDSSLTGGVAGAGGIGCSSGLAGQPIASFGPATSTAFPATHQTVSANSPVREGGALAITFQGEVGELAFYRLGATPDWILIPELQGATITGPGLFKVAGLLGGALGTKTLNVTLSEITDPGVAVNLFLQGVFYNALSDAITMGGGTSLTLLDASN